MAIHRTRKNKESPNYNFLYSWSPSEADVKGESQIAKKLTHAKLSSAKNAEIQAKDNLNERIKKDILKSLALVSLMLITEVVVYLARSKFGIN